MRTIVDVVDMRSFAESLNRQAKLPADSYELLAGVASGRSSPSIA